jgi:hypothetical protein
VGKGVPMLGDNVGFFGACDVHTDESQTQQRCGQQSHDRKHRARLCNPQGALPEWKA